MTGSDSQFRNQDSHKGLQVPNHYEQKNHNVFLLLLYSFLFCPLLQLVATNDLKVDMVWFYKGSEVKRQLLLEIRQQDKTVLKLITFINQLSANYCLNDEFFCPELTVQNPNPQKLKLSDTKEKKIFTFEIILDKINDSVFNKNYYKY